MFRCVLVLLLKPVPLLENQVPLTNGLKHAAASQNFLRDRWCLATSWPVKGTCKPATALNNVIFS